MPRLPRTESEVDAFRSQILDEALGLFVEAGWEGFSMRKLGARLGIAAKTIYNYVHSRDEIYLELLIRGFQELHEALTTAIGVHTDPWEQMGAMVEAYLEFGLGHPHLYDLMFSWRVPRYDDYVGTPLERLALVELGAALDNQRLMAQLVTACLIHAGPVSEEDLRFVVVRAWTQLHGYIAGVNATIVG